MLEFLFKQKTRVFGTQIFCDLILSLAKNYTEFGHYSQAEHLLLVGKNYIPAEGYGKTLAEF